MSALVTLSRQLALRYLGDPLVKKLTKSTKSGFVEKFVKLCPWLAGLSTILNMLGEEVVELAVELESDKYNLRLTAVVITVPESAPQTPPSQLIRMEIGSAVQMIGDAKNIKIKTTNQRIAAFILLLL
jgi:hypothetical protein